MTRGQRSIVWVTHPEAHRYVRETTIVHPHRRSRPGRRWCPGAVLVAYEALAVDAGRSEPSGFSRRIWWLAQRDLEGAYGEDGLPAEGVDPMGLIA